MHPLESSVLLLLYVCPLLDMQPRNVSEEGNKKPPSFPLFLFSPEFLYMEREKVHKRFLFVVMQEGRY